jgi:hypothetical protein
MRLRQVASAMKLKQHRKQPVSPSKRQVSMAVRASNGEQTTERLPAAPCNRNRSYKKMSHLADVLECPPVLRTQPVSSTIPAELRNSRTPDERLDDDLTIPAFLRRL